MTDNPITWRIALRPLKILAVKHLPGWLFRRFYKKREFERDILLSPSASEAFVYFERGNFKPPHLKICFTVTNMSPYLDAEIVCFGILLWSSDYWGDQQGLFATIDDWTHRKLRRRASVPLHAQFILNPFQVDILKKVIEPTNAKLHGFIAVHFNTKLGNIPVSDHFAVENIKTVR